MIARKQGNKDFIFIILESLIYPPPPPKLVFGLRAALGPFIVVAMTTESSRSSNEMFHESEAIHLKNGRHFVSELMSTASATICFVKIVNYLVNSISSERKRMYLRNLFMLLVY